MQRCDANGNGGDGIDTHQGEVGGTPSAPSTVLISQVSATGNTDDGIDTAASQGVTLLDVCAAMNTSDGIVVKQHGAALSITAAAVLGNRYGMGLTNTMAAPVSIMGSDLSGNIVGGAVNEQIGAAIAAIGNFWGAATGPTHPANSGGSGDLVYDMANGATGTIDYAGFVGTPLLPSTCPERQGGNAITAIPVMGSWGFLLLALLLCATALLTLRRPS